MAGRGTCRWQVRGADLSDIETDAGHRTLPQLKTSVLVVPRQSEPLNLHQLLLRTLREEGGGGGGGGGVQGDGILASGRMQGRDGRGRAGDSGGSGHAGEPTVLLHSSHSLARPHQ